MQNNNLNDDDFRKVERNLEELAKKDIRAKTILADYINEKWLLENGIIDQNTFNNYQSSVAKRIVDLPNELEDLDNIDFEEKASVFLSYSRMDQNEAMRLRKEFAKYNIRVRMDIMDVKAGQTIEDFIIQQTRESEAVIMLISKNSFSSGWIGYEYAMAMFGQLLIDKKIIPVSIDEFYREDSFSGYAHSELQKKIDDKNAAIKHHDENGWAADQFEKSRRRLRNALNQLSSVLKKLQEISVYSIADFELELSIKKIADQLLSKKHN